VLLGLVYVALWLHTKLKWALPEQKEVAVTPRDRPAQKA